FLFFEIWLRFRILILLSLKIFCFLYFWFLGKNRIWGTIYYARKRHFLSPRKHSVWQATHENKGERNVLSSFRVLLGVWVGCNLKRLLNIKIGL
ncbi:hypothetical protein, partial [Enterococcus cecorum]|uniref:hypothetical protein n=1 Tax=Enterococcus cecorum TaxID=44008 RepID=UPI001C0F2684